MRRFNHATYGEYDEAAQLQQNLTDCQQIIGEYLNTNLHLEIKPENSFSEYQSFLAASSDLINKFVSHFKQNGDIIGLVSELNAFYEATTYVSENLQENLQDGLGPMLPS